MLPNGVMNAEDVARYLHLGKNTVYQLAKTGQLASYHVGRKLRFTLEDVEAYVASTRQSSEGAILQPPFSKPTPQTQAAQSAKPVSQSGAQSISDAAAFGKLPGNAFVLAGGDAMADLIASNLNAIGMPVTRLVRGSYTALVNLYAGDADAAVVHLYDQRANSYNIPYVRSLAPGASVVVFRLYGRRVGFIVQAGNPKGLTTWGSLLRDGVQLSNRTKGSGARVLLDEKLRALEARSEQIEGYDSHATVATGAIARVSSGLADVAIGTERESRREANVEFVPLQTEWVDLVVAKTPRTRPAIRRLTELFASPRFAQDLRVLEPCDPSKLGTVIYES